MALVLAGTLPALAQGNAPVQPKGYELQGQAEFCDATVYFGPNERGASSSAPGGRQLIVYDPAVMEMLPYIEGFVFAHECAHHVLGHTSMIGLLQEGHDFQTKELDADCWAAEALMIAGQQTILRTQVALFRNLGNDRPGPRYPRFDERADRLEACAQNAPKG